MLRDYQQEAVNTLFWQWEHGRTKPCIMQLCTGAGKSIIISEIVSRAQVPTLILQPSKEILEQNYEKLLLAGVPEKDVEICSASANSWMIGKITLATIGTIGKHHDYCKHFKIIIVDENDVVNIEKANGQYLKFFNNLREQGHQPLIVGLTATPFRNLPRLDVKTGNPMVNCYPLTRIPTIGGNKTPYGTWFWGGGIIYKCNIPTLQEKGFLAKTQYFEAKTDWSFVRDYPGRSDFNTEEMTKWMEYDDNLSRFHQAIKYCKDRNLKTIVFTPNIDMNYRLANCIRDGGGTAETMDSDNDSKKSRQAKMDAFRRGDFEFLVNVGMVGRGVDVPSVDAVILARPTKSLSLYLQYIGRSLRIDPNNPKKVATILDLAGNVARFGRAEDVNLEQEAAVTPSGWEYMKDIITIMLNGKRYKWERVG